MAQPAKGHRDTHTHTHTHTHIKMEKKRRNRVRYRLIDFTLGYKSVIRKIIKYIAINLKQSKQIN